MKSMNVAAALAVALLCAGCAGSPDPNATREVENESRKVSVELINWKGREIGAQIPQWLQDAMINPSALERLPQFEGKAVIYSENEGRNLNLLKSWANNFDVQGTVARGVQNQVQATFGGTQGGDMDDEEREAFQQEVVASFSNVQLRGLNKELDFWIQTRTRDRELKTTSDVYHYYVVYAIDRAALQELVAEAMGAVQAKDEREQALKDEVRAAMTEVRSIAIPEE